jgi:hypothetical protein
MRREIVRIVEDETMRLLVAYYVEQKAAKQLGPIEGQIAGIWRSIYSTVSGPSHTFRCCISNESRF